MIGDFNGATNFPYRLLLTDRQVSRLYKALANNLLVNIKLAKLELPKPLQLEGFLGRRLKPLLKTNCLL